MSHWKAAGIHLLLSAAIIGGVVLVMLRLWYPSPLFEAAGGKRLLFILAAVHLTIGPLLTLIIFKSGKKGLVFDLTVIALMQAAALAYGVHTVHLARPVYLVFTVDRFELVTAKDLDPADLVLVTRPEFKRPGPGGPRYIGVIAPSDPEERLKVTITALSGKDLKMYPQYYVPYAEVAETALKRAEPLEKLLARERVTIERALAHLDRAVRSVRYLPLRAKSEDAAVLLDAVSGDPVGTVLVDPW